MAASKGRNEGFHVLKEIVCTAIPVSGSRSGRHKVTRKAKAERPRRSDSIGLKPKRVAELRSWDNSRLLSHMQTTGTKLTAAELALIHEIAVERLARGNGSSDGADQLSREAMRVTLERLASGHE